MNRPLLLSLPLLLLACRTGDKDEIQDLTDSGDEPGDSATQYINTPPVVESVVITPDALSTDDVAVANVTNSDADGDGVSLSYVWFIDGLVVDDVGAELSGELYFDKGQSITVSVTGLLARQATRFGWMPASMSRLMPSWAALDFCSPRICGSMM